MYVPFSGGDLIVATKVTTFQIGTGDLKIKDIPEDMLSLREIKIENALIIAEVRDAMTEEDVFERNTLAISAIENSENY